MQAWTALLDWLRRGLLPFMVMSLVVPENIEAAPHFPNMPMNPGAGGNWDDMNDEAPDEIEEASSPKPKGKKNQNKRSGEKKKKIGNKKGKKNHKGKKQSLKVKAREKARGKATTRQEAQKKANAEKTAQSLKELKAAFCEAEEFHKTWFNMPFPKIKASHEKLTKLCKSACTKSQCADEKMANNCHLMCPESTTKNCPDPLKQADHESLEPDEFVQDDDEQTAMVEPTDHSSSINSSIAQADAVLKGDVLGDGVTEDEDSEEG